MSSEFSEIDSDVSEGAHTNEVLKSGSEKQLNDASLIVKRGQELKIKKTGTSKNQPKMIRSLKNWPKLSERSKQYQKHFQEKLNSQREKYEREEMKECSFTPTINKSFKQKRTPDEFYKDMMAFQLHKKDSIDREHRLKEEHKETYSFHPSICVKSEIMLMKKTAIPWDIRLYRDPNKPANVFKSRVSNDCSKDSMVAPPSNIPKISKIASKIERPKAVYQILYEDAVRRIKSQTTPASPKHSSMSALSQKLVTSGFLREFNYVALLVDVERTGLLNYRSYKKFFKSMGLIRKGKSYTEDLVLILEIWEKSKKINDKIMIRDLMVIMMGIMGYYQPWMSDPDSQEFVMTLQECKEFHETYIRLFHNRFGEKRMRVSKKYAKLFVPESRNDIMKKDRSSIEHTSSRRNSRYSLVFFDNDSCFQKSKSIFSRSGSITSLLTNLQTLRRASEDYLPLKKREHKNYLNSEDLNESKIHEIESCSSSSQSEIATLRESRSVNIINDDYI